MKDKTGVRMAYSEKHAGWSRTADPARVLRTAVGAALALAGSPVAAWADHRGHPTPNSISYLDRRMYIHNIPILHRTKRLSTSRRTFGTVGSFPWITQGANLDER